MELPVTKICVSPVHQLPAKPQVPTDTVAWGATGMLIVVLFTNATNGRLT